jgi:hypothetical protein
MQNKENFMMVKTFLAGAVLFGASLAMAYPAVGDKVEWTGSVVSSNGTSVPVKITKEVLSYNDTTKKWTVKEDKIVGDKTETETKEKSWMFDSAKYAKLIAECVSKGGTLEDITVAGGTFSTCGYSKTDDDEVKQRWIGDVPWGIVKSIETDNDDGEVKTLELSSITLGK